MPENGAESTESSEGPAKIFQAKACLGNILLQPAWVRDVWQ